MVSRLRDARRQQEIRPPPISTQRTDVHLQLASARQHDMVTGIGRDNLVRARSAYLVEHGKRIRRDPDMGREPRLVHRDLLPDPHLGKLLFLLDSPAAAHKRALPVSRAASPQH